MLFSTWDRAASVCSALRTLALLRASICSSSAATPAWEVTPRMEAAELVPVRLVAFSFSAARAPLAKASSRRAVMSADFSVVSATIWSRFVASRPTMTSEAAPPVAKVRSSEPEMAAPRSSATVTAPSRASPMRPVRPSAASPAAAKLLSKLAEIRPVFSSAWAAMSSRSCP